MPGKHEIRMTKGGSWIKADDQFEIITKLASQSLDSSFPKASDQKISTKQGEPVQTPLKATSQHF